MYSLIEQDARITVRLFGLPARHVSEAGPAAGLFPVEISVLPSRSISSDPYSVAAGH
jgi:hypothetical protein